MYKLSKMQFQECRLSRACWPLVEGLLNLMKIKTGSSPYKGGKETDRVMLLLTKKFSGLSYTYGLPRWYPCQGGFSQKSKIQFYHVYREGLNQRNRRPNTTDGTGSGVISEDLNINISTPLGSHNAIFQAEYIEIINSHRSEYLCNSIAVLLALQNNCMNLGLISE